MSGDFNEVIQQLSLIALPLLFAITVHEAAHGWAALKLGDDTAYHLGRLTLNPIKHIDPIGTILLPLFMFFTAGFAFGWAKPVPVNFLRLRRPRRDMALVALAGPMANLLMAILWGIIAKIGMMMGDTFPATTFLFLAGIYGVMINVALMILNLLPILPLDGGRILHGLLPPKMGDAYGELEPYGLIVLVVLLATGILGKIIGPGIMFVFELFKSILV